MVGERSMTVRPRLNQVRPVERGLQGARSERRFRTLKDRHRAARLGGRQTERLRGRLSLGWLRVQFGGELKERREIFLALPP
jgi:hypothetical protein